MTHPIIEDLMWRYTTKKYDPYRKVAEEDLNVFLEAVRLSASSINSQPWKLIHLTTGDAKQRMHDTFVDKHLNNQPHVFEASHFFLIAYNPHYTREDFAKVVDKYIADGRVLPENRDKAFNAFRFAETNTDESGYNGAWTKAQTYLALGNALHTLARLRIDATPIEGIDVERVNATFKKELAGYRCEVALAIGYHHEREDYNKRLPKSRLEFNDILLQV